MNGEKIIKSDEEQIATASIEYLNQKRQEAYLTGIAKQDENFEMAIKNFRKMCKTVSECIIERNRGGTKGGHGFVAEGLECAFGNARAQVRGKPSEYIWVNNNGAEDIIRNGTYIQQKFVKEFHSLYAVKQHYEKYPWFTENAGKYQIPKDFYKQLVELRTISEEEAYKRGIFREWKRVNEYFGRGDIKLEDIEPSFLAYEEVQIDNVPETIRKEEKKIHEIDREMREEIQEATRPTLKQGAKVALVSAVIEGGTEFVSAIVRRRREGKQLEEFTEEDWLEVLKESGISTIKGGGRGISIYALTNYTATPAMVANALCTALFGVAKQGNLFRKGVITKNEFILNCEMLCLEAAISALSSSIGQAIIPIPVLGTIIGNTVGMLLYQVGKDVLPKRQQRMIERYIVSKSKLERVLDEKYKECITELQEGMQLYYHLLEQVMSPDYELAFQGSIELGRYLGVVEDKLLKNIKEVDEYFMA